MDEHAALWFFRLCLAAGVALMIVLQVIYQSDTAKLLSQTQTECSGSMKRLTELDDKIDLITELELFEGE